MKKIVIAVITMALIGCASVQQIKPEDRTFHRIVEVKGSDKDAIYESSKRWIAHTFNSAKAVIEYQDREAGKIIGNGAIQYPCSGLECIAKGDWKILFTMSIDAKDERFRMTFSNLQLTWPPQYTTPARAGFKGPLSTQGDLDAVKPVLLAFGDSMAEFIKKPAVSDDW